MIVTVKTFIDKTAFLMIPDPSVFASAFTMKATQLLESELERINGNVERTLTRKQFELEVSKIPKLLKSESKIYLSDGIEANFEFTEASELIITLKGVSTVVTSTMFH